MEFRTRVDIAPPGFAIPPFEKMLFVGSCFAENMGRRFAGYKFRAEVNPYGVMYNPASILHTVSRTSSAPRVAVLTLGTNRVYVLNSTGEIVDNCRKRPHSLFTERSLTVDECVDYLSDAVRTLRDRCPDVRVIVTVSPIRYAKYGYHGSALSKSVLLLAADALVRRFPATVTYFPAYEIVNDELRDYRFYAPDMLHPSEQAVEYVWERFADAFFSDAARRFIAEWRPLKKALEHRPFNPDAPEYKAFVEKTRRDISLLAERYPGMEP